MTRVCIYHFLQAWKRCNKVCRDVRFLSPVRFCRGIFTAMHFYGIREIFLLLFARRHPSDISSSASSVMVRSLCVFFFKLVKLDGFIFNASSAFWNYMQINRIVIIWTFAQYLARIARAFFKHFCAYRSDIVESSVL